VDRRDVTPVPRNNVFARQVKQLWSHEPLVVSWLGKQVKPHVFGHLPRGENARTSDHADSMSTTAPKERRT
jgi:xanthosine utilization system XapX-like protein